MSDRPKSDFEKLSEYRWGLADEQTRREVELELTRPDSPLSTLLARMTGATRAWFQETVGRDPAPHTLVPDTRAAGTGNVPPAERQVPDGPTDRAAG